jgi:hypothetical protein
MRSKSSSSGVVPIEEYAVRVERRRSMRMMQQAEKRGSGGVVSVGLGEQLKGLGLMSAQQAPMSGGLGGFRVVEGMKMKGGGTEREVGYQGQSDGEGESGEVAVGVARRESKWLRVKRTTTKKNLREQGVGCGMPVSPCN